MLRAVLCSLILAAGFCADISKVAAETTVETIVVDGETRTYRLHIPEGGGPHPIVFSFHGLRSDAAHQERLSQFSTLADREGFIAVYPEGLGAKWRFMSRSDADVLFTVAVIEQLAGRTSITRDRIYATGISNGAQMAWRLACDRPDLFAAFGFVAGGYFKVCDTPVRRAIILFHGTNDRLLPYDGRGRLMPVREFAQSWAKSPVLHLTCPPVGEDGIFYTKGDAVGERWQCGPVTEVVLFTLRGKGHSWPGSQMPAQITSQDVDATEAMWAFFKAHPRP